MATLYGLIDKKKKAEVLQRIREKKAPFCAVKPGPEVRQYGDVRMDLDMISAVYGRKEAEAKYLLGQGADANAKDSLGLTALVIVASNRAGVPIDRAESSCDIEITKALIQAGAHVNACDNDNMTALMYASRNGFTEIVKLLLRSGAKVNLADRYGRTAIRFAKWNHRDIIVGLLKRNDATE
jgi:ankyrin repeat protein